MSRSDEELADATKSEADEILANAKAEAENTLAASRAEAAERSKQVPRWRRDEGSQRV